MKTTKIRKYNAVNFSYETNDVKLKQALAIFLVIIREFLIPTYRNE